MLEVRIRTIRRRASASVLSVEGEYWRRGGHRSDVMADNIEEGHLSLGNREFVPRYYKCLVFGSYYMEEQLIKQYI